MRRAVSIRLGAVFMSLNVVVTGNTVLAADINQLVNYLQRSSGSTEVGKYYCAGWGNASKAECRKMAKRPFRARNAAASG